MGRGGAARSIQSVIGIVLVIVFSRLGLFLDGREDLVNVELDAGVVVLIFPVRMLVVDLLHGVTDGVAVGVSDGVTVGVSEGVTVGVSVGVSVGCSVGVTVGVSVGVALGVSEGVALGVSVGCSVGVSVGAASVPSSPSASDSSGVANSKAIKSHARMRFIVFPFSPAGWML